MIVDCHTHWKSDDRFADASDPSAWLDVLDRHGITHAIVTPNAALSDDSQIRRDNEDVAAAFAASAGRMIPFHTVNPAMGERALQESLRCIETLKHRGLKLHPWLQGISLNTSVMDSLCEIAAAHEIPILVHDGTPPSSMPSQVAMLAKRHPRTVLVLGHCGLFEHWREAIAAMNYADNLWGCLCGPSMAAMRQIVARCDRRRLLWGSDYGYGKKDPIGYRLDVFKSLNLDDQDMQAILCDNPARLLHLEPTATKPQNADEP